MTNRFNWDEELLKKLGQLPPERRAEVEAFVDILLRRQAEVDQETAGGAGPGCLSG